MLDLSTMNLKRCLLFPHCFSEMEVQPSDLTNAFGLKETGMTQINTVLQYVMHLKTL